MQSRDGFMGDFVLMKTCEYCGGPDHAVGLCRAVAAVEYRNGDVVKRVEFNRDAAYMQEAAEAELAAAIIGAAGATAQC